MVDHRKGTTGEGVEDQRNEGNWREMGHNTKDAQHDAIFGRERDKTQGASNNEEQSDTLKSSGVEPDIVDKKKDPMSE